MGRMEITLHFLRIITLKVQESRSHLWNNGFHGVIFMRHCYVFFAHRQRLWCCAFLQWCSLVVFHTVDRLTDQKDNVLLVEGINDNYINVDHSFSVPLLPLILAMHTLLLLLSLCYYYWLFVHSMSRRDSLMPHTIYLCCCFLKNVRSNHNSMQFLCK